MNFQNIPPVDNSKVMLDLAFRKARERGKSKNLTGNWLQIIRQKEAMKLDIIKDSLVPRLQKILSDFPGTIELPHFYITMMELTLDFPYLKKSFGAVSWAIDKIRFFHKDFVRKIPKTKEREAIKEITKQFYGRISSIMKQIDKHLSYLEDCRKIMRTYPDIKEMFTVCIYGFPNVGKTTLLNKLTGTTAKVAAYAFTTKSINAGYMDLGTNKDNLNTKSKKLTKLNDVQVLDVPGTLARKEKLNPIEMQAELVLEELSDVIIFVFDLSDTCGYSVKKQEQLLKKLGNYPNVFVYLSKQDLLEEEDLTNFKYKHYSIEELKEIIALKLNPK